MRAQSAQGKERPEGKAACHGPAAAKWVSRGPTGGVTCYEESELKQGKEGTLQPHKGMAKPEESEACSCTR